MFAQQRDLLSSLNANSSHYIGYPGQLKGFLSSQVLEVDLGGELNPVGKRGNIYLDKKQNT